MGTEFDYRREMNRLSFTKEQKEEMTRQLLEQAKNHTVQNRRRSGFRMGRFGLIAACLTGVLVVGAGATGILKTAGEAFADVFGGGAAETEIINQIGRPVGASDTDNGLTITADAIIGDEYSVCVVYTLTREDGEIFELESEEYLPMMFESADLNTGTFGGSHGSSYFIDPVPGDNSIQYVEQSTNDTPVAGRTATAEFQNLKVVSGETAETLVEGHWKLKFDLNYEDCSVTVDGNGQTFRRNGMDYTVNDIHISPVSYTVNYTVNAEPKWSNSEGGKMSPEDESTMASFLTGFPMELIKADGTVMEIGNTGGSLSVKDGVTVCARSAMFDTIQPMEDLVSIRINGLEFPLH